MIQVERERRGFNHTSPLLERVNQESNKQPLTSRGAAGSEEGDELHLQINMAKNLATLYRSWLVMAKALVSTA